VSLTGETKMTAPGIPEPITRDTYTMPTSTMHKEFDLFESEKAKDVGRGRYKSMAPHASIVTIGRVFVLDKATLKPRKTTKLPQQNLLNADQKILDTIAGAGSCIYPTVVDNRISFTTKVGNCLAYYQDTLWYTLVGAHNRDQEVLYCQDMYKNRSSYAWFCNVANAGKDLETLTKMVNLYMRIPWLLLNPGENATRFARIKSPAKKVLYSANGRVQVLMPGCVLYSPALFWFTCALFREVIDLVHGFQLFKEGKDNSTFSYDASKRYQPNNYRNRAELCDKLMGTIGTKELNRIIDTHDYESALELWYKLRPYIAAIAMESGSMNSAWFHPSPWNNASLSGLWAFENIVNRGGWSSIGPSMKETWGFKAEGTNNIITHGGTARPWERYLMDTAAEPGMTGTSTSKSLSIAKNRPLDLRKQIDEIHLHVKQNIKALTWVPKDV
jgi:hypothetical protein